MVVLCEVPDYVQRPLQSAVPTWRTYKLATVPRGLTNEQALKVLQHIDRTSNVGRRDYAIFKLLYTYGVRGGQVRALDTTISTRLIIKSLLAPPNTAKTVCCL